MVGASARYSNLRIPVETVTPPWNRDAFCGRHDAAWRLGGFRGEPYSPPEAFLLFEQGRKIGFVFTGGVYVGE